MSTEQQAPLHYDNRIDTASEAGCHAHLQGSAKRTDAHWHVGRDGDGEDAIVDEHRQTQVFEEEEPA